MKIDDNFEFMSYNKLTLFEKELYYNKCYYFVQKLNIEYPYFNRWFNNLFQIFPYLKDDREILFCRYKNDIIGIAILKKTLEEQKICTLRVSKNFQKMSIGKKLMEMSFEWLENDRPLITVHKSKQHEFDKLFQRYGFQLEDKKWCYYHMFSTELAYNGELPSKFILMTSSEMDGLRKIIYEFINKGIFDFNMITERFIELWLKQSYS